MDSRETAIEFARAFCAADLARLESVLHPELELRGPLFEFHTRDEYLGSLRRAPRQPAACEILQVHGTGSEAAILYEYRKPVAPVLVAQFNRQKGGLITEVRLVFDSAQVS